MKLLRYFNHENIISILDIQKPRNYENFSEVYLIQVSENLYIALLNKTYQSGTYGDRHAPRYSYAGSV